MTSRYQKLISGMLMLWSKDCTHIRIEMPRVTVHSVSRQAVQLAAHLSAHEYVCPKAVRASAFPNRSPGSALDGRFEDVQLETLELLTSTEHAGSVTSSGPQCFSDPIGLLSLHVVRILKAHYV